MSIEATLLSNLVIKAHQANSLWWRNPATGEPIERNVGEMLMLIVSELSEAMEGHRKGLMDDKLPDRPMIEDMAGGLKLDLGGAVMEKLEYNCTRKDHTIEARLAAGGKRY